MFAPGARSPAELLQKSAENYIRPFLVAFIPLALFVLGIGVIRSVVPCVDQSCGYRPQRQYYWFITAGPLSVFLAGWSTWPQVSSWYARAARVSRASRIAIVMAAITFLALFVIHFGNRQFGGYDFSVLIDTAWRLASGQRPYVDFVCTPPPGFYLGAKYAFRLFGANWDAQLWMTALFSAVTFVWLFSICIRLLNSYAIALVVAFMVESGAILVTDFWWYNNVTAVTAAIFLLSCILYSRQPGRRFAQVSYVGSLPALALMKPNVSGLLICGAVVLLFIADQSKLRFLFLTALGLLTTLAVLAANSVDVRDLLGAYRDAAAGRGLPGVVIKRLGGTRLARLIPYIGALCVPLFPAAVRVKKAMACRNWRSAAQTSLFFLAAFVCMYAMVTNGEFKEVDWVTWLAADTVLIIECTWRPRLPLPRFWFAFLLSLVFINLYFGAIRYRVYTIGAYFDWAHQTRIRVPFFKDLIASETFADVLQQIGEAVENEREGVFFGPRMEFAYAAFGLPSPKHLPPWWDPGTSFAWRKEGTLVHIWVAQRFRTLIFLKDDFTDYSPLFQKVINERYMRDDHFSELTIMRAKPLIAAGQTVTPQWKYSR